jgi:hypothetical protein
MTPRTRRIHEAGQALYRGLCARTAARPAVRHAPSAADFDAAFARLDALRGFNSVHLAELRRELGCPREDFDRLLDQLRRAGRYSCAGAEGRGGLTAEDRAAGIREGDQLLVYVSSRRA